VRKRKREGEREVGKRERCLEHERERERELGSDVPLCSILYPSCQEFLADGAAFRFSDKTYDFFTSIALKRKANYLVLFLL
jgi:hypothetical protein